MVQPDGTPATPVAPPVGIDSFSYHRRFGETSPWEPADPLRWTTTDLLDRAAELDAEMVSLQTCYLGIDPSTRAGGRQIATLAEAVRQRGLRALFAWGHRDGLRAGTDPDRVEQARAWIAAAATFDVPVVRIVASDQRFFSQPVAERVQRLEGILRSLSEMAADHGVDLALENHADMRMVDLVGMVEQVDHQSLGVCLDLGNALRVGDDVGAAARLAAPHTRMVHVKDLKVIEASIGDPAAWWPTVPVGEGDLAASGALVDALEATLSSPRLVGWFVEMANMHPDTPHEDAAVAASLEFLRRFRAQMAVGG